MGRPDAVAEAPSLLHGMAVIGRVRGGGGGDENESEADGTKQRVDVVEGGDATMSCDDLRSSAKLH
jgi:hypothetical protein